MTGDIHYNSIQDGGEEELLKTDLRPDRINRKRLAEATDEQLTKKLTFCRKNPKTGATEVLREDLSSFVAQQCAKDIDQSIRKRGLTYYTLRCGDDELPALGFVLDWIKECGEQKDEVKIQPTTLPSVDPANPFGFPIKVFVIAGRLKIPWDSFGKFLLKHYIKEARSHIIDLDLVRDMYDDLNPDFKPIPAVRELACTSILEAWFNLKLDTDEYEDYCYELSDLRDRFPELDDDLHAAITAKNEFIAASRLKRRQKREEEAEEARAAQVDGGLDEQYNTGYGRTETGAEDAAVWATHGAGTSVGGWDKSANGCGSGDASTWADQVNDSASPASASTPATAMGGW